MKKTLLSIGIAAFMTLFASAQGTTPNPMNPNAPKVKFETEVIDYGTVECNADGNREFKFKNIGKEPLIISNCTGSCGCTVPTWPKEPIAPGATSSIKVHYDTGRCGQAFEKTVTVSSNAETASVLLKIKGVVKAKDAQATPAPAVTEPKK